MSREEILEKLNEIFRDIFDDEEIVITEETTPEDVEDWDSLGHIYLTAEIEDEFDIKMDERMKDIESVITLLEI